MRIVAAIMEDSMGILPKIKNGSVFWPSDSISGNKFKGTQNTNLKEPKLLYVPCSIIYNRQDKEAVQVSISRWVDKMRHLHNGILLGDKKGENFTPVTVWMDLEIITLSEISQSEKDKYHMI